MPTFNFVEPMGCISMNTSRNTKISNILTAGLLSAGATMSFDVQATPPTGSVSVRSIQYAGTGCPIGSDSVRAQVTTDSGYLNLRFLSSAINVAVGPGVPLTQSRKNCSVIVDLDYPPEWSYSVVAAEYQGYARLGYAVTATVSTSTYFSGSSQTARLQTVLVGPHPGSNYERMSALPEGEWLWSPCASERNLVLNPSYRASNSANPAARGFLGRKRPEYNAYASYSLLWRRCPGG